MKMVTVTPAEQFGPSNFVKDWVADQDQDWCKEVGLGLFYDILNEPVDVDSCSEFLVNLAPDASGHGVFQSLVRGKLIKWNRHVLERLGWKPAGYGYLPHSQHAPVDFVNTVLGADHQINYRIERRIQGLLSSFWFVSDVVNISRHYVESTWAALGRGQSMDWANLMQEAFKGDIKRLRAAGNCRTGIGPFLSWYVRTFIALHSNASSVAQPPPRNHCGLALDGSDDWTSILAFAHRALLLKEQYVANLHGEKAKLEARLREARCQPSLGGTVASLSAEVAVLKGELEHAKGQFLCSVEREEKLRMEVGACHDLKRQLMELLGTRERELTKLRRALHDERTRVTKLNEEFARIIDEADEHKRELMSEALAMKGELEELRRDSETWPVMRDLSFGEHAVLDAMAEGRLNGSKDMAAYLTCVRNLVYDVMKNTGMAIDSTGSVSGSEEYNEILDSPGFVFFTQPIDFITEDPLHGEIASICTQKIWP